MKIKYEDVYCLAETKVKLEIIKRIMESETIKYDSSKFDAIQEVLREDED